jgi:hypothetical protein
MFESWDAVLTMGKHSSGPGKDWGERWLSDKCGHCELFLMFIHTNIFEAVFIIVN